MSLEEKDEMLQQKKLLKIIEEDPSHRNYWNVHKRLKKIKFSPQDIPSTSQMKIALLSSFTIDPLAMYLDIDNRMIGLFPETYIGPFNRFRDEVMNKDSGLYKFNPDLITFFVQHDSLVTDNFKVIFSRMNTKQKRDEIDRISSDLNQLMDILVKNTNAIILFSNFIVPADSPLGILDNKQEIGYKRFFTLLNDKLESVFVNSNQVFILDLNNVVSNFGKSKYMNFPMYYRGSLVFNDTCLSQVSYEIMAYIKALKSKNRKCIVLDLDNTLWGGIIGEDGVDGIKLNLTYPGNEFVDFQRTLLSLYNKGIILAVNSKNNETDALEVFRKHPYMQIKEKHLATYRINWEDKVKNLIDIANEINIGLDSIVFIDDNPVERERVKSSLPEVLVPDIPSSPSLYRNFVEKLNDFNTLTLTKEDLTRGELYKARKKRKDLKQKIQSIEEFLQSLEITAEIKYGNEFSLSRITSLVNRTNQFNLTTKRYTEKEVKEIHEDTDQYLLYTLRVRDKFGDEGIVGVAIIKKESAESWTIDTFLMSCRVIGRKIETTFLYKIIKDAQKAEVKFLHTIYIPSRKNSLVKDFYPDNGFKMKKTGIEGEVNFQLSLENIQISYPSYLQVDEDEL